MLCFVLQKHMLKEELVARFGVEVALSLSLS